MLRVTGPCAVVIFRVKVWLWRWLPHRLSKRQSVPTTTVLFRTTFTRTIKLNLLLKWLLDSNLSQDYYYYCYKYVLAKFKTTATIIVFGVLMIWRIIIACVFFSRARSFFLSKRLLRRLTRRVLSAEGEWHPPWSPWFFRSYSVSSNSVTK